MDILAFYFSMNHKRESHLTADYLLEYFLRVRADLSTPSRDCPFRALANVASQGVAYESCS